MKMPYFCLYFCIPNYCPEVLLLAKYSSGTKYCASWAYMVLLLGKRFVPSTLEVDYSKSKKTSSRCYVCFQQRTGKKRSKILY